MIDVCLPSKRPKRFAEMARSVRSTSDAKILVSVDVEDASAFSNTGYDILKADDGLKTNERWNTMARIGNGDCVMMGADDLIFETKGWDTLAQEAMPEDGIGCVWLNDGYQTGPAELDRDGRTRNLCNHPIIGRQAFDVLGYLACEKFNHFQVDRLITYLFESIGRMFFLKDVIVRHNHWSNAKHNHISIGNVERDKVYQKNMGGGKPGQDKDTYERNKELWIRDIEKLKNHLR